MTKLWKWINNFVVLATAFQLVCGAVGYMKGIGIMETIKLIWESPNFWFYSATVTFMIWTASRISFLKRYGVSRKWRIEFGIYWDENLKPRCPACHKPLSLVGRGSNVLRCISCNKEDIYLTYRRKHYSIEEAADAMRNGEIPA